MKRPRTEYGPSEGAPMLRDLSIAAQRLQREEFDKIVAPVSEKLSRARNIESSD
jgi:hypothetical protein